MNNEQITVLARELADGLYNDDKFYNSILWWCEEPKERKAEELEHTLRILLRRYYLVEKDEIKAKYQTAKELLNAGIKENNMTVAAPMLTRLHTLREIFPEIAKEVEE